MKSALKNFCLQLSETEAQQLERMARQNARSRGAELRIALREKIERDRQSGAVPNFGQLS